MKVCLFILALCLFLFTNVYSQRHRFSAGIDAGAAFPLGRYADKSMSDSGGQAQTGISLNLHVSYRISRTFGITLVAGGQENKKSLPALQENIEQGVPGITSLKIDTKSWQIGKLMGGGVVRIPIADSGRVIFIAGAAAGICKARVPGYSYSFVAGSGANIYAVSAKYDSRNLPWAFCYNIRSGVAFRISKLLYVSGSLSCFDAKPEETFYRFGVPEETNPSYQVKHPLTSLSAEAGIEIQL